MALIGSEFFLAHRTCATKPFVGRYLPGGTGFAEGFASVGPRAQGSLPTARGNVGVGLRHGDADGDRLGPPLSRTACRKPDRACRIRRILFDIDRRCVGHTRHVRLSAFFRHMVIKSYFGGLRNSFPKKSHFSVLRGDIRASVERGSFRWPIFMERLYNCGRTLSCEKCALAKSGLL